MLLSVLRLSLAVLVGLGACLHAVAGDVASRATWFRGWSDLDGWKRTVEPATRARVWTSPIVRSPGEWTELVMSWNATPPPGAGLQFEARAFRAEQATKYYTLGRWSADAAQPRESVRNQRDDAGDVETDTLALREPAGRFQLRVTELGGEQGSAVPVRFLGVSVLDPRVSVPVGKPDQRAWGRALVVPERAQGNYPGGAQEWCSPTSVSMVLAYWARELGRPELDHDVPDVVKGVFDRNWPGTGNWPFNTAFAGSLPGMRAYVTRFTDVAELEAWVERGVPVVVSVCYDLLRGRPRTRNSGHLVVCAGFTAEGDVVMNDPGTRDQVRKVFLRENLVRAWAHSKNTVYLIYPADLTPPRDRHEHWFGRKR